MAKDLVTVVDSNGHEFPSRRCWAEKKRESGEVSVGVDGKYRFTLHSQYNGGASAETPQGTGARLTLPPIRLRPDEPTPSSNGDFLTYPFPSDRSSAPLRLRFPTLARAGAGL